MTLTLITDHAAQMQARLLEQMRGRPVMAALLAAFGAAVQLCEGQLFSLSTGRSLFGMTAQGAQLDAIGALVGIGRNGLTDAQYYVVIAGQIGANGSQADNETLLRLTLLVFQASSAQVLSAVSPGHSHLRAPASIAIEVGAPQIASAMFAVAVTLLRRSIAAGVALDRLSVYAGSDAFALAGAAAGKGLADANVQGSGGAIASSVALG